VFVFALAALGLNLLMGFRVRSASAMPASGDRRLRRRRRPHPSRRAVVAVLHRGRGGVRAGGVLVGRPILRLKGHYLAVARRFGLLLAIVFTNEARFTGGPDGMAVPRLSSLRLALRGADV
jgi:branched-chain amino acid transport system permease protein